MWKIPDLGKIRTSMIYVTSDKKCPYFAEIGAVLPAISLLTFGFLARKLLAMFSRQESQARRQNFSRAEN
jgi:hypothetical protein